MKVKIYKNQNIMRSLTSYGGILGILLPALHISGVFSTWHVNIIPIIYSEIIGVIISFFAIHMGLYPNDPIPFHWVILLILAILMFLFGASIGALLVIIAALIGLIEDL